MGWLIWGIKAVLAMILVLHIHPLVTTSDADIYV